MWIQNGLSSAQFSSKIKLHPDVISTGHCGRIGYWVLVHCNTHCSGLRSVQALVYFYENFCKTPLQWRLWLLATAHLKVLKSLKVVLRRGFLLRSSIRQLSIISKKKNSFIEFIQNSIDCQTCIFIDNFSSLISYTLFVLRINTACSHCPIWKIR